MAKYSYEENTIVVASTFKMQMLLVIKKLLKNNSKTFFELK